MVRQALRAGVQLIITPIAIGLGSLAFTNYAAGPYPHRLGLSTAVSILASVVVTWVWALVDRPVGRWITAHFRYSALLYLLLPLYAMLLQEGTTAPGGRVFVVAAISAILANGAVLAGRLHWTSRHNNTATTGTQSGTA
jgi:hypothetical protein